MLEKYGFGGIYFSIQALLSLYSQGLQTGLVFDCGDGVSHTIPVIQNYIQDHAIGRLNVAGRHVTQNLIKLLLLRGHAFNSTADFEVVRDIKESQSYIAYDIQ